VQTNAGARQQSRFEVAPGSKLPRSKFDLSHGLKTAIDGEYIYPVLCEEMLPGDTFQCRENLFARFYTMKRAIMHPIYITTWYFAVPVRLLWDNWEKFHGYRTGPSDSDVQSDFSVPEITVPSGGFAEGSLYDYLGIPPGVEHDRVNALFARAYTFIWNEWFRDGDLIDEETWSTGDGPDATVTHQLEKRAKRKDYLTSARPWPQAPGTDTTLPLGTEAPVVTNGNPVQFQLGGSNRVLEYQSHDHGLGGSPTLDWGFTAAHSSADSAVTFGPESGLKTDLTNATAATINDLREAFQIQRVFEREARSGRRHVEHIKAFWGVTSPDFRLQRPEFLSGKRTMININPVEQTAIGANATDNVPGDLYAHGTASSNSQGWTYTATEHMVVLGLANLSADVVYQDGLQRKHWRGTDRFDYPLPQLMHLGEQVVENREVYSDATDQDGVFGYQERWAEYRYAESRVSGAMRSSHTNSLDIEHLALDFGSEPSLNQSFIEDEPPFSRILLVPSGETRPALRLDFWWNLTAARCMPTYSVPGLIDHL
jgi:hypothetical protein